MMFFKTNHWQYPIQRLLRVWLLISEIHNAKGLWPRNSNYLPLSGTGPHPGEQDTLVINILAKLADGVTVVEDTYKTGKPFITTLAGLFPGLNEPLQMMAEGSKWQLFIPSVLAYGDKGTTLIPPNSALVIEAELVAVKPVKK